MLVGGKRSSLDIFENILTSLSEGQLKKTHLTYKANLDSRLASKYVQALEKLQLVTKSSKDPSYYIITEKGRDFLEQYYELIKFVNLNV
ncbi:MAG TPA: winged helix-turn-helix domain-containing protein [Nitrosopumilaceae archaeon]|nr:winged helix-turn-helix domain-containing protein [Nitrosopumilaceae archaeon]